MLAGNIWVQSFPLMVVFQLVWASGLCFLSSISLSGSIFPIASGVFRIRKRNVMGKDSFYLICLPRAVSLCYPTVSYLFVNCLKDLKALKNMSIDHQNQEILLPCDGPARPVWWLFWLVRFVECGWVFQGGMVQNRLWNEVSSKRD